MIRYASCVWELPMPTTFRAYQPDQPLLLPPDLQEWVPPGWSDPLKVVQIC